MRDVRTHNSRTVPGGGVKKVKVQGHKVTWRISSENAMTRPWVVVSASNLVRIFTARGERR